MISAQLLVSQACCFFFYYCVQVVQRKQNGLTRLKVRVQRSTSANTGKKAVGTVIQ